MSNDFVPEVVIPDLKVSSKRDALRELAKSVADLVGRDEKIIFEVLLERENLGSTGIGKGIAIPHARLDGLDKVVGVFAKLNEPVDFEAQDDKPVDLMFMFLSPSDAGSDHLNALANISGLFRNSEICAKLRSAFSSDDILAVIKS